MPIFDYNLPKWCAHLKHSIIVLVSISTYFSITAETKGRSIIEYTPNPSYDNIQITPKTWEEVDFIYKSMIRGKQYTNAIQLLRPIKWLEKRHMNKIGAQRMLSIPEFGITNVNATITHIKPTKLDTRGIDWSKQKNKPIIGKFMHYVTYIHTYAFKDENGHISYISATPNHPFYVQNKHGFLPIDHIRDTDNLVGISDHGAVNIHLLHSHEHPHSHQQPIAVYNLEVYKSHIYLSGDAKLIIHNYCQDPEARSNAAKLIQRAYRRYRSNLLAYKNPVFWSGGENAQKAAVLLARDIDGTTMEMTHIGKETTRLTQKLSWNSAKPHWEEASSEFAKKSYGRVYRVLYNRSISREDSVWANIEKPLIRRKELLEEVDGIYNYKTDGKCLIFQGRRSVFKSIDENDDVFLS